MSRTLPTLPTGALRRFKSYPAYKDSGVEWLGDVPEHWQVLAAGRLVERIEQGWSPVADDREAGPGEWAVIKLSAVSRGTFQAHEHKALPEGVSPDIRYEVHAGDFLLTRANTPELVGDVCVVRKSPPRLMLCDLVYRLHLTPRFVVPEFLSYWFLSSNGRYQIEVEARGSSQSMVKVSQGHIRAWRVVVPSPPEQRAIVAFLDRETARIDALVAKKERLIELLQEQRTALITRVITKGLDPNVPMKDSGIEWLGEIPAHWEVKRLKHLSRFVTSGSRGWAEHYTDDGALFLRIGNLRTASIDLDLSDVQHVTPPQGVEGERTRVCAGDLLISITALIGAVGVVPEGTPPAFVNQHLALVRLSGRKVLPRWLGYCVLSRFGQEQLHAELYGGTKDGLSLNDIRSLAVLVPTMDEQLRVIDTLDSASRHVEALVAKVCDAIDRLKELRIALISAAVTGKVDVREEVA